ncbi:MAG: hypothetical protein NZN28_05990 [Meiothermus sp.]|nr:hypothetical protein [Meiothermus sp.]MCS7068167.1 hypothetical protein [Meiothermus sp.]
MRRLFLEFMQPVWNPPLDPAVSLCPDGLGWEVLGQVVALT